MSCPLLKIVLAGAMFQQMHEKRFIVLIGTNIPHIPQKMNYDTFGQFEPTNSSHYSSFISQLHTSVPVNNDRQHMPARNRSSSTKIVVDRVQAAKAHQSTSLIRGIKYNLCAISVHDWAFK